MLPQKYYVWRKTLLIHFELDTDGTQFGLKLVLHHIRLTSALNAQSQSCRRQLLLLFHRDKAFLMLFTSPHTHHIEA